jgi:predicted O-methyltransferase YrrM
MNIASILVTVLFLAYSEFALGSSDESIEDSVSSLINKAMGWYPKTQRRESFDLAMRLIVLRKSKIWVETGTSRNGRANCIGDGCSTVVLSNLRKLLGDEEVQFYSVDIDTKGCEEARESLEEFGSDAAQVIESDSIAFLRDFTARTGHERIDFLYLDSYDYTRTDPLPSQMHHLHELHAAMNKLHDGSIILLDDCLLPFGGKCRFVGAYLMTHGWKPLYGNYQELYIRDPQKPVDESSDEL